jgi:hypothetical protein
VAGRRRTLKVKDLTLGLHDFPERAKPGNASVATNVEFVNGGISTRPGTSRKATLINNQKHDFKGCWFWRDSAGTGLHVVAYVIRDGGGNDDEGRLLVLTPSGALVQTLVFTDTFGVAANFEAGPDFGRWSATPWMDAGIDEPVLIIGVSNPHNRVAASHLFVLRTQPGGGPGNQYALATTLAVNRNVGVQNPGVPEFPFWGGEIASASIESDDLGPYLTVQNEVGGGVVSIHDERLVTNLTNLTPNVNNRFSVRLSNVGDKDGWPEAGVAFVDERSPEKITGMAEWEGRLLVFTPSSMSSIIYGDRFTFNKNVVLRNTGCVSHQTIQQISKGGRNWVVWLAQDGVYAWSGGADPDYVSDRIEKRIRSDRHPTDWGSAWSFHWPEKNQYWLIIPDEYRFGAAFAYVWDYYYDAWSEFEMGTGNGRPYLLGISHDNARWKQGVRRPLIFLDENGDSDDLSVFSMNFGSYTDVGLASGSAYKTKWESHPIPFNDNTTRRFRYLRPTLAMHNDKEPNDTRTFYWMLDEQSRNQSNTAGQSGTVPGHPEGADVGGLFGAVVFGQDRLGVIGTFEHRVDMHGGVARDVRFGVESATANRPVQVLSVEIDLLNRGARR